jgi:hypothetical protein
MEENATDAEIEQLEAALSVESAQDRRATEFLELEQELAHELRESTGAASKSGDPFTTGRVVAAERVSVIPASYPQPPTTDEALALDIRIDSGQHTRIYTDWPGTAVEETPVGRLLARLDLSLATFGDLYGKPIPLERVENQYVLSLPPGASRPSRGWVDGVIACLGAQLLFVAFPVFFTTTSPLFVSNFLFGVGVATWVFLPIFTYFDVTYIRTNSTWTPTRALWPLCMVLWGLNIPIGVAYLYKRWQADVRQW